MCVTLFCPTIPTFTQKQNTTEEGIAHWCQRWDHESLEGFACMGEIKGYSNGKSLHCDINDSQTVCPGIDRSVKEGLAPHMGLCDDGGREGE